MNVPLESIFPSFLFTDIEEDSSHTTLSTYWSLGQLRSSFERILFRPASRRLLADLKLLPNGQAALPVSCLRSSLRGRAGILGPGFQSSRAVLLGMIGTTWSFTSSHESLRFIKGQRCDWNAETVGRLLFYYEAFHYDEFETVGIFPRIEWHTRSASQFFSWNGDFSVCETTNFSRSRSNGNYKSWTFKRYRANVLHHNSHINSVFSPIFRWRTLFIVTRR